MQGVSVWDHEPGADELLDARVAAGWRPTPSALQSGDAVVNGRDARQWNVSFVGLINRLTTEGGVPYYLAPGNHELALRGSSSTGTAFATVRWRDTFATY